MCALLCGSAHALQWNKCKFVIEDSPDNVDAKKPDGYKIYLLQEQQIVRVIDVGPDLERLCDKVLTRDDRGDFTAYATAYNAAGESDGGTPQINFFVDPPVDIPSNPALHIRTVIK